MKLIAVSQRVTETSPNREIRDSLDQRWFAFLDRCRLIPLLIPNNRRAAEGLLQQTQPKGVLLTGGDDLARYGGTHPERDEVEALLADFASSRNLPLFGVCRGMQFIQSRFGVELKKVAGHVAPAQSIEIRGQRAERNSYHNWGTTESAKELNVWAKAADGVVKAIAHVSKPISAVMWHPERSSPFLEEDIALFRGFFGT